MAVLAVSILSFALGPGRFRTRVLYFPRILDQQIRGEERVVPLRGGPRAAEANAELLLEEIILGPADLLYGAILPVDTELRVFMLRDDQVYIDFSAAAVTNRANLITSIDHAFDLIEQTLVFNFPSIADVHITIEGNIPNHPHYEF